MKIRNKLLLQLLAALVLLSEYITREFGKTMRIVIDFLQ